MPGIGGDDYPERPNFRRPVIKRPKIEELEEDEAEIDEDDEAQCQSNFQEFNKLQKEYKGQLLEVNRTRNRIKHIEKQIEFLQPLKLKLQDYEARLKEVSAKISEYLEKEKPPEPAQRRIKT